MLLTVAVLTGCSEGPAMNREEAKKSVLDFVNHSAETVGDGWAIDSGPGLGKCTRSLGRGGVAYLVITARDAGPDPAADVEAVERFWKQEGVATERYQSGGAEPVLGVRGAGGPLASIDFLADPRGYSIQGESACVAGDFDQISRDSLE